jgi:autotransporter translocation and assembly factor TamB
MKLRKVKKVSIYFLISILVLFLLAVISINFPFAHRYITKKVNHILSNANIPVSINSISTILPGSLAVNGVKIIDDKGDTIIYAEDLRAAFSTVGLLKRKVIIQNAYIGNSEIKFLRNNKDCCSGEI